MVGSVLERRLPLFPISTRVETRGGRDCLTVAGLALAELAEAHGTPLYLYDQATLDSAVAGYRHALAEHFPGEAGITYAGKAFLCVAMAQWTERRGLWLDCTGAGELHVAKVAGVAGEHILVHGVQKTQADLAAAVSQSGTLVVDSLAELDTLVSGFADWPGSMPDLWLRIRPGVAVETHAYRQTGQADSKFGMGWTEVAEAVRLCQVQRLPLTGLHFHLGSHFRDPAPLGPALDRVLDLVGALQEESGWVPEVLCPGGGWGVAYHEDGLPHPAVGDYVGFLAGCVVEGCARRGLPLPRLQLEPGRSIVAQAGVALYRLGAVKRTSHCRWLLLDGGLADNPRPALYGSRYSALPVWDPGRPAEGKAWLAGPYCESGDILIEDLTMPNVEPGELIAVPVSGAYQLSMASNYNGARRPAVIWLDEGRAHLVQRRQTVDDLVSRDLPLEGGRGEP